MEKESRFKVFALYIRQNIINIFVFAAFMAIFALIFFLYKLPSEALLYALILCAVVCAVIIPFRFLRYYKKHKEYANALKNARVMSDALPDPDTLQERDAAMLLSKLKSELEASIAEMDTERRESIDFYTTWVHQIKTPISVMRMLLENEDTDEHRELLAELFRIEQYAEMVLTYLRLGSEASDYVFRKYDIDGIIKQAVRKYAPLFIRRRIRVIYEPVHAEVLTDEKWLLFIIEQILSNSAKYTHEGSVTINLTPEHMLKISDTGIGISEEDLPRIFEKGFTGYNGRADKKSTGLGLYLCKTAADKLGHKIYAESCPGKGTTVSIDLRTEALVIE